MEQQNNRPHRPVKEKKKHEKGQKNVKAFAVANPGRLQRQAVRSSDVKERRLHVPLVDRLPEEAPPIVVAVVGPPGVGKTTLIKSLIKRYTKQSLSHPVGPLTVVTSKRRRLTLVECPSDSLSAMIDVAKIADIVLLMIDGNYGFEMETMEFLNVLNTSGMPGNVFGILTHLDLFKKQSTLRMAKKRLKHRFWSELYQGAKLFYLSGVINGRYPDREIHNLSRFLSVMKNPRPLVWRNSHPYCLADRFLDITPPTQIEEDAKCDRQIALYGYLRGTNFPAANARIHIPGVGDLSVKEVEALPDPCPTPFLEQANAKASGKANSRRLGEKQKLLFAPMSDVGGVLVDKDAVYVDIKYPTFDKNAEHDTDRGLGEQLMLSLQNERKMLGEGDVGVQLFRGGAALNSQDEVADLGRQVKRNARHVEQDEDNLDLEVDNDDEMYESGSENDGIVSASDIDLVEPSGVPGFAAKNNRKNSTDKENLAFADSDSDIGSISSVEDQEFDKLSESGSENEDHSGVLRWKDNIAEKARNLHTHKIAYRAADLSRMIYDLSLSPRQVVSRWSSAGQARDEPEPDEEEDEETFFKKTDIEKQEEIEDRMIPKYDYEELSRKWQDEDLLEGIRQRFIRAPSGTGANAIGEDHDEDAENNEDIESDEGDGDYEDLEAEAPTNGEAAHMNIEANLEAERAKNAERKAELKLRFEEEDREGFANEKNDTQPHPDRFGEDEWYDAQKAALQKQVDINRAEFDMLDPHSRAKAQGHKAGTYARIVLQDVPYEFSRSFNPRFPIILGGLAPTEERFGFVQVRIKRHRWHKKILKTNDPLIFSLGWRRFQSLPIYSIHENRMRHRMLKYTPEHMHCTGTFYGPLVAPNTGFCAVQSLSNANKGFRIAATGVVLDADENTEIVKKLKLTGHPYKIFRNTAFIRDMFSSAIEIAKFEGAAIKTVSGIRGQIKRALAKPEGHYRATFEDKILMSDIIFLRAWYPIKPHRFYNPVTDLLDAPAVEHSMDGLKAEGKAGWKAMRLTGAIRASLDIPTPSAPDSRYVRIERPARHFNPLRVPRALAAELPFKSQIVAPKARRDPTYLQKRAVVLGSEEKRARDLLQKLATIRREKVEKRAAKKEQGRQQYRAKVEKSLALKAERERREKDDYWRREGRKRSSDADGGGGTGKRQRR